VELVNSQSVAAHLNWRTFVGLPQFDDVRTDPRVQEAIARWEAEEEELRDDVRAYLEDLQSAG